MKKAVAIKDCTYGTPPRFFSRGDVLLFDGECPKHFREVDGGRGTEDGGRRTEDGGQRTEDGGQKTEIRNSESEVDLTGKTLSEAVPGPLTHAAEQVSAKSADAPCTVEELAEKLGVSVGAVKTASGRLRKNEKLSSEEVSAVKAAFRRSPESSAKE